MLKFFTETSEITVLCTSAPGLTPPLLKICYLKAAKQAEDWCVGNQPARSSSHPMLTEKYDGEGWSVQSSSPPHTDPHQELPEETHKPIEQPDQRGTRSYFNSSLTQLKLNLMVDSL